MTNEEKRAKAEQIKAQMDKLAAEAKEIGYNPFLDVRLKVSTKGAISLYGLGQRFPTTLFKDQWETVLGQGENIRAFISANASSLKLSSDRVKK